jgi:phytoene synthase
MTSKSLFDIISIKTSRLTTHQYSTSFSTGIRCLSKELRDPVYSIYGFVRFADEIVDSFHDYNKEELLQRFKEDTYKAIEEKISLHPILNSFQFTVHLFNIDRMLIDQFLKSMEMDLKHKTYDERKFNEYVLGSAESVGLMCLCVFCKEDPALFAQLKPFAQKLGSAFQKINFLRDLREDYIEMGRCYFPSINFSEFNEKWKKEIEGDIKKDFDEGYQGIKQLPRSSRLGVYVAYLYYLALFKKIKNTPLEKVLKYRVRIHHRHKISILCYSFLKYQLNLI